MPSRGYKREKGSPKKEWVSKDSREIMTKPRGEAQSITTRDGAVTRGIPLMLTLSTLLMLTICIESCSAVYARPKTGLNPCIVESETFRQFPRCSLSAFENEDLKDPTGVASESTPTIHSTHSSSEGTKMSGDVV